MIETIELDDMESDFSEGLFYMTEWNTTSHILLEKNLEDKVLVKIEVKDVIEHA